MTRTEAQLINDINKAISNGDLDRTAFLLDEWSRFFSARPDLDTLLTLACTCGSIPIVCLLLSHGARVCTDAVIAAQACEPYTRSLEIFQAFLDSGWDINDSFGHIGDLLIMSAHWPPAVLKWALAHGADPNSNLNGISRSALEMSVLRNSTEHVEALIAAGAHINNTNALKVAACHGRTKMIELLLEKGADINEIPRPDHFDMDNDMSPGLGTALHEAVEYGQLAAVKVLLEKGADPTLRNTSGETALDLAQKYDHEAIVEVLKRRLRINT